MATEIDDGFVLLQKEDAYDIDEQTQLSEALLPNQRILDWLKPTKYDEDGGEFARHLASHAPSTNEWIFKTDEWKQWYEGADQGLLWIKGIPGAGKSVLAAHLVRRLNRDNDAVVLYFFFRQIIDANHTPQSLLRDHLAQILTSSPSVQSELSRYVLAGRDIASVSMADFWRILRLGLSNQKRVYVVADALDEMDHGNDQFVTEIAQLGHWQRSRIKVLMTSRPTPAIESVLRHASPLQIRLDERLVDVDITAYIAHCLSSSSIAPSDKTLIHETIPGHANGLFLYARLAMDRLMKPGADVQATLGAIPQSLNAMFNTLLLEHAERLGTSLEFQSTILQWATHATRPLRLLELSDVIQFVYGEPRDSSLGDVKSLIRTSCGALIEILPNETLSVIHHSLTEFLKGWTRDSASSPSMPNAFPVFEAGPTHLTLAHACIQYLSPFGLDGSKGTSSIDDAYGLPNGRVNYNVDHPFAEYASKNWYIHVAKGIAAGVPHEEERHMFQSIDHFLAVVREVKVLQSRVLPHLGIPDASSVHVIARMGLPRYVARILDADPSVLNMRDTYNNTPLHLAAQSGHHAVVELLLNRGAEPSPAKRSQETPLHLAAAEGHSRVISVFLEAGVDPLTTVDHDPPRWGDDPPMVAETALSHVCTRGHSDALDAMIPYLRTDGRTEALALAARTGFTAAVRRILELPDIQVDACYCGDTPLLFACRWRRYESIKLLLEAGADPNLAGTRKSHMVSDEKFLRRMKHDGLRPERRFTAMHAFAEAMAHHSTPRKAVANEVEAEAEVVGSTMMALLQAGGQVNVQDLEGDTPLHHACRDTGVPRPSQLTSVIVKLLLEVGAEVNMPNDKGMTPLHLCTTPNHGKILRSLIEDGRADVNRKNASGVTPLMSLLEVKGSSVTNKRDEPIVLVFLKYKPDCKATDMKGDSALHVALRARHGLSIGRMHDNAISLKDKMVDTLLASGADPNQRNHEGKTPLHQLCVDKTLIDQYATLTGMGWFELEKRIISLMIGAGADLETKDRNGRTMLFDMIACDLSIVNVLVDLGCDVHTNDHEGRSLLHELIKQTLKVKINNKSKNIREALDFLISRGLDPGVMDHSGNSLLHELAATGNAAACQDISELLRTMIPTNQRNHAGQTPLHIAADVARHRGQNCTSTPMVDESFDLILQMCGDPGAVDNDLSTPLHVAAASSAYRVLRLLDGGADMFAVNSAGHTVLHIASRNRRSNIVGLICERSKESGRQDASDFIDAQDHGGWTALHYACQSGRPESVDILLSNGANPNTRDPHGVTPLAACAEFEKQRTHSQNGGLGDRGSSVEHEGTRLEEIVRALIAYGADPSQAIGQSRDVWDYVCKEALHREYTYTYACFSGLRKDFRLLDDHFRAPELSSYASLWVKEKFTSVQKAYDDCDKPSRSGASGLLVSGFVRSLLSERQFGLVRQFIKTADAGVVRHCRPIFIDGGHVDLLEESFQHHPITAENTSEKTPNAQTFPGLLYQACQRSLPNTAVLKCLLRHGEYQLKIPLAEATAEISQTFSNDTPLHVLARGEHWWQVAEGIPCLLDAGADINANSKKAGTPLHVALGRISKRRLSHQDGKPGNFAKKAAQLLIMRGADVNVHSPSDQPCLTMSMDGDIIDSLLEHGAERSVSVLFRSLLEGDAGLLDTLLSAGFGPNEKVMRGDRDMTWLFTHPVKGPPQRPYIRKRDPPDYSLGAGEVYPLLFAASRRMYQADAYRVSPASWNETKLVRTLMKHGADPTCSVLKPVPHSPDHALNLAANNETDMINQSILHAILYDGGCSEQLLKWPGLDLEMRDQRGMTLFLAACCGKIRQDRHFAHDFYSASYDLTDTHPQPIPVTEQLITLGADVYARDANDNNALHLLAAFVHRNATHIQVVNRLLQTAPELLQATNSAGETPFHTALRSRDVDVINRMLDAGADANLLDAAGNNALHHLGRTAQVIDLFTQEPMSVLIKRFLALGLDINSRNAKGETMLHHIMRHSILNGYVRQVEGDGAEGADAKPKIVFDALIDAGADVFAQDDEGNTLLHLIAARAEQVRGFSDRSGRLLTYLVELGLDPLAENAQYRTSLDLAVAGRRRSILRFFEGDVGTTGR